MRYLLPLNLDSIYWVLRWDIYGVGEMDLPLRLLLVEDSAIDAKLLIRHIQREGYDVTSKRVDTAPAMQDALDTEEWDIIISDYSMPLFSGIDALYLLQSTKIDIPFIMVSGVMGEDTAVAVMRAGANDYIIKDNLQRLVPTIERELREAEQRRALCIAQEQINLLSQALAQSSSLVMMTNTGGTIEYINPTFTQVTGYYLDDIIGNSVKQFFNLPDEFNCEIYSQTELICKRKDSSEYWASLVVSPVRNADGSVHKCLFLQEDITTRKLLEKQLQDYTEDLEQLVGERTAELSEKNRLLEEEVAERRQIQAKLAIARDKAIESLRIKNQILANVNHDMQTPLSVISLRAQMLQRTINDLLNEKQKQYIESIIDEVDLLSDYFKQLLAVANAEASRINLYYENLNLKFFLNELLLQFKPLADKKNLELSGHLGAEMPNVVYTDINLLQQVVEQLMNNAIQYTEQGKVEIHFGQINPDRWSIEIIDTGAGIPEEAQLDIFEPFFQVDGSASRPVHRGSGLGLVIVKHYIEAMGGTVTVESDGKSGSKFMLQLPFSVDKN